MKEFELTCFAYKSDKQYECEVNEAIRAAEKAGTDVRKVKVRKTADIPVTAETYYMGGERKGRRMVKLTIAGNEFQLHIPARDFSLVLQDMEFDVTDVRSKTR